MTGRHQSPTNLDFGVFHLLGSFFFTHSQAFELINFHHRPKHFSFRIAFDLHKVYCCFRFRVLNREFTVILLSTFRKQIASMCWSTDLIFVSVFIKFFYYLFCSFVSKAIMFTRLFGKPKQEADALTTLDKLNEVGFCEIFFLRQSIDCFWNGWFIRKYVVTMMISHTYRLFVVF